MDFNSNAIEPANGKSSANEHPVRSSSIGPPRWGFCLMDAETQADGLGCHRSATLWRNRMACSYDRNSRAGNGIRAFPSQRDTPMSAWANGPGTPRYKRTKPQRGGHKMDFNSNAIEPANWRSSANEYPVAASSIGPPRWCLCHLDAETQADGADGLGCHRSATLWQNHPACSENRNSRGGNGPCAFLPQWDTPMSGWANGPGTNPGAD